MEEPRWAYATTTYWPIILPDIQVNQLVLS